MLQHRVSSGTVLVALEQSATKTVVLPCAIKTTTDRHVISNEHQTRTPLDRRLRKRRSMNFFWHPPTKQGRGERTVIGHRAARGRRKSARTSVDDGKEIVHGRQSKGRRIKEQEKELWVPTEVAIL
jgi:hypothetical protein